MKARSILVLLALTVLATCLTQAQPDSVKLEALLDKLEPENVLAHARAISEARVGGAGYPAFCKTCLPSGEGVLSRVTGYPGYYTAVEYVVSKLLELGLKPEIINFTVLVPYDEESWIEIPSAGVKLRAYAVWPNGHVGVWNVSGLKGRLVYVGKGRLEDFEGKSVEGAIVVMDFDSGGNWRNALKLGAKAVVFVESGRADRYEAYSKFEWYAFYPFIRLYVAGEDARKLIELAIDNYEAVIESRIALREVEAYDIIVKIPGKREDEAILLVASLDTWSVVPALAQSVHDAVNVGLLLELARIAKSADLERSLWIGFLSGHWQGLAGARYLAEHFTKDPELATGKKVIWYVVGVDLSDDFPATSLVYMGHFYRAGRPVFTAKYGWVQQLVATRLRPFLEEYLNGKGLIPPNLRNAIAELGLMREIDLAEGPDWSWSGTMATPYVLDTEPFVVASMAGFTVRTQFSYRNWEGVPGVAPLRWEYVVPQLYQVAALAFEMAMAEEVRLSPADVRPTHFTGFGGGGAAGTIFWGLVTFRVSVATFNLSAGWYTPVQGVIIRAWSYPHDYPFACVLARSDSKGMAELVGLAPQGVNYWMIDAVKFDEDGVYVVDRGVYGVALGSLIIGALQDPMPVFVPVFKGGVVVLADMVSPRMFRPGAVDDPRMGGIRTWYSWGREVRVYEVDTKAEPMFWSVYARAQDEVVLVAAPVGSRVIITAKPENPSLEPKPPILLTNSTQDDPEGRGLLVKPGFYVVRTPALRYALDVYRVAKHRYAQLRDRGVRRLSAEVYEKYAAEYIDRALKAYEELEYAEAYRYSLLALSYSARYYVDEVMPLYDETARTVVLMLFIVLPSAYFLERLLVHSEGLKRILATIAFGALAVLAFSNVHPALVVIANSAMSILGTSVLLIAVFMLYVFAGETSAALRSYAVSRLGFHEFRRGEASAALMAVSIGIENMRRRPLRTLLTLITVTAVATAVVSLTSTSPTAMISVSEQAASAPYEGLLVRRGLGVLDEILTPVTVEAIKGLAGEAVVPRVWYYPVSVNKVGPYGLVTSSKGYLVVQGVLGLTREEAEALLRKALSNGTLYQNGQVYACLLTRRQAEELGVEIGDRVEFAGFELIVTGILSDEALQGLPRDADGYSYLPLDPTYSPILYGFSVGGGQMSPTPLAWERVLIVPTAFALKLGGFVNSVGVVEYNATLEDMMGLARDIAYAVDARVTVYKAGSARTVYRVLGYAMFGWEFVAPLLVLGAVNVVITLLAAVYERTREMLVFSAVGLSPRGAALMFTVEFMVYGFIGSFIGYMSGWALSRYFAESGLLPETFVFNYASSSVLLAMATVVLVCIAAAVYPAVKAARLITPSLERVWKPSTKPRGDTWELVFPLRLTSREEAIGLLRYLKEYFEGAGSYKPSFRVTEVGEVDVENMELALRVLLTPIETGTEQSVSIKVIEQVGRRYSLGVTAKFLGGSRTVWLSTAVYFFDDLRKQLLLWASLPLKEKKRYVDLVFS